MVSNRTCPVCQGRYYANSNRLKHGRATTCSRDCSYKLRADKRRKPEAEKFDTKAYNRAYYQKNKEAINLHVKEYRQKTGYKYVLSDEQRAKSNAKARAWYQANKQVMIARSKLWKKANRDKVNAGSRSYASRRRGAEGRYSVSDYMRLKNRYAGLCAYCGNNEANSIDHVTPLSMGGSNYIGNILPVCGYCNSSKGGKTLYDWKVSNGRLLTI